MPGRERSADVRSKTRRQQVQLKTGRMDRGGGAAIPKDACAQANAQAALRHALGAGNATSARTHARCVMCAFEPAFRLERDPGDAGNGPDCSDQAGTRPPDGWRPPGGGAPLAPLCRREPAASPWQWHRPPQQQSLQGTSTQTCDMRRLSRRATSHSTPLQLCCAALPAQCTTCLLALSCLFYKLASRLQCNRQEAVASMVLVWGEINQPPRPRARTQPYHTEVVCHE